MTVSREQVTEALRDVFDPELGMSVVDLGLIYDVQVDGGQIRVVMTLTAPGCPLHDAMSEWVRQAVGKISGVGAVDVTVTFEPLWTPDRMQRSGAPRS
ncbi:MAG TPA: metal-sulfur cluster assembly factor [Candidatus Methylomirabilis sp.]|nr:metal-sulfur cluster assembly factor [Candidatus Methylomirabilis sp.]